MTRAEDPRASLRRRALRAARAVTMTVAVASWSPVACTAETGELDGVDSGRGPGDVARSDGSQPDASRRDGALADAGGCTVEPDGVCPPSENASTDPDCCMQAGGSWTCSADGFAGCVVAGPFVPPAFEDGVGLDLA